MVTGNCVYSAEQIMERLFQSIPGNAQEIIIFASLLQLVSEFRHPEATRETTSKPLGRFEGKLRNTTHIRTSKNCWYGYEHWKAF